MPKATIAFSHMIQDSQDYGSDNEHMVSRVFFDLTIDGRVFPGLYADIKQTVGSSFESAPIEVSPPVGYDGPMNHAAFRAAVENYCRSLVGGSGSGIHISGSANVRMRNNMFGKKASATFDVALTGRSW